ncbi:kelch-like protein 40 isoform X2 [Drosophila takahashii]|uniref:kelch-like protein 40 isoform X2 n=1 Tax=Drosophila takahashii TaxID=29030 RepID=UPI00389903B0
METWLGSSYKKLLEEGDFSDCCVIVGTRRFHCHKMVLSVASDFFKRIFQPGFAEAKTGEVTLSDVTEDIFEKFQLYVYSYKKKCLSSYTNKDIIKLHKCADMWLVEPLKKHCDNILRNRLNTMNCKDLVICFEQAHGMNDKLIGLISEQLKLQMIATTTISEEFLVIV